VNAQERSDERVDPTSAWQKQFVETETTVAGPGESPNQQSGCVVGRRALCDPFEEFRIFGVELLR
jgi:hypothetical protein